MLTKFFQGCSMRDFPLNEKNNAFYCSCLHFYEFWKVATYLGHGVIFDNKSSTANDIPRINKQLPKPFHSVVTP